MNKYISMFAIAAGLMACASCSSDDDSAIDSNTLVKKTFGISQGTEDTRVKVQGNIADNEASSWGLLWEGDESVSVFAEGHSNGSSFAFDHFISGESKNQAYFTGETFDVAQYYFLYPAQSGAKLKGSNITLTVPYQQKAVVGGVDPSAAIQVGKATNESTKLGMKNVCAFFKIKVSANCKYISIGTGESNWGLAGQIEVTPGSEGGEVTFSSKKPTVELTEIPASGGTFLIAFIPSTKCPGLTIDVRYDMSAAGVYVPTTKQFLAGRVYNLGDWSAGKEDHFPTTE